MHRLWEMENIVRVRRNVVRRERGGSLEIGFEECEQSNFCQKTTGKS